MTLMPAVHYSVEVPDPGTEGDYAVPTFTSRNTRHTTTTPGAPGAPQVRPA